MKKPFVIVMVGLPGAGKSTQIQQYIKEDPTLFVLSTDNIVESIAVTMGLTYDEAWPLNIDKATKMYNEQMARYISENKSFIVDRTNLTKESRLKILSRIPKHYTKIAHVVECSERERAFRIKNRPGKTIPDYVNLQMVRAYQRPDISEGFSIVTSTYTGETT